MKTADMIRELLGTRPALLRPAFLAEVAERLAYLDERVAILSGGEDPGEEQAVQTTLTDRLEAEP